MPTSQIYAFDPRSRVFPPPAAQPPEPSARDLKEAATQSPPKASAKEPFDLTDYLQYLQCAEWGWF